MTRTRELIAGVAAILFIAQSSWGVITGSKHDFTGLGDSDGAAFDTSPEICGPCHTPHQPKQNVPLWSHTPTGSTFALYNTNPEYSGNNSGAYPVGSYDFSGSMSAACLSCHDGTVGANQDVFLDNGDAWILWDDGAAVAGGEGSTGLMGSHPVGVDYSAVVAGADAAYYNASPTGTAVKLENSRVQCISCHNAHNVVANMLVEANTGSALCLRCHIK